MWKCPKCQEDVEDTFTVCWNCGTAQDGTEDPDFQPSDEWVPEIEDYEKSGSPKIPDGMIVTTPSLESHQVEKYLGVVCGEAIVGANIFRDMFAGITDIVGGRSYAYESALTEARKIALNEMARRTVKLGGNAILSVKLDYESPRGSMLMVTCTGTAVIVTGPQAINIPDTEA